MKKITTFILALTVCASLCACGGNTSEEPTEEATTIITSAEVEAEIEETAKVEFSHVNTGDVITTDFVEITIGSTDFGERLKKGNVSYLPSNDKNNYFWLSAVLKNTTGNAYSLTQGMNAVITFNDTYNYEADIRCFSGSDMDPLVENDIFICAEIPASLAESYEKVTVKFGFNNNFSEYDYDKYGYEKLLENFDNLFEYTYDTAPVEDETVTE